MSVITLAPKNQAHFIAYELESARGVPGFIFAELIFGMFSKCTFLAYGSFNHHSATTPAQRIYISILGEWSVFHCNIEF
jgi:hypothetical protein